jgi:hypothetical protein
MCELAFIEYNPTFDSIMTLMIGLHLFFLEMSKKRWQRFRVRNSTVIEMTILTQSFFTL